MREGDSKHVMVATIDGGAKLYRFKNAGGVDYSAIYLNGHEAASCERDREASMVEWWNGSGMSECWKSD